MIKKIQYIYRFLYYSSINRYSMISFFPILSIAVGTIVICFTIGVMDGMEEAIFEKMNSFNFNYTGELNEDSFKVPGYDVYTGSDRKYLIFKDDAPKVVTITAINNLNQFKEKYIAQHLIYDSKLSGIIIGRGLASTLGVKVGDKVSVASPLDINLVTGIAPVDTSIVVSAIFNYNILDYDYNYAFISDLSSSEILKFSKDKIFLKSISASNLSNGLVTEHKLVSFKDKNGTFFKAINTERLLYSLFGYIVIFIASVSSLFLMSLFITRKKKQIVILKTLGVSDSFIRNILVVNSLLVSFFGVLIGLFVYGIIISINSNIYFIQDTFFSNLAFDFSIGFDFIYIAYLLLICSILMVCGAVYPILKISKINLASILNEKV